MIHQSPPAARRARGSLLRGGGPDRQDRLVPPLLLGAQRPAQHSPALPRSPGNRHDGPVKALGGARVREPINYWNHSVRDKVQALLRRLWFRVSESVRRARSNPATVKALGGCICFPVLGASEGYYSGCCRC